MRHVREVLAASAPLPTLHARAALPGDPSALGCVRAGLRRARAGASSPLLGSMPCAGALWLGTTAKPRLGAFPLPCRFCSCLLKARGASPGRGEVVRGAKTPFFPAPCSSAATPEQQPVSQPRGERARKRPAPGFRGAKKQCVQVDASRCSRLSNRDPSVLGILPHPQLSVLPLFLFWCLLFLPPAAWRTCLFLACTSGHQGRRHVPLSDSAALSPALSEHSPRRPQSGRASMAATESLTQRLVSEQTGAACRCLHGAGGS